MGRGGDGVVTVRVNPESSAESSVFIWTGKVKGKELYSLSKASTDALNLK